MPHLFYLHGFASSPGSGKARLYADCLAEAGLPLHCPDLNEPDFSTLTVSRMIDQVESAIGALPKAEVAVIGSSLGGFVAWHLGARQTHVASHPIRRLILLAPALDFGRDRGGHPGDPQIERWRRIGHLDVFHHAYGATRAVGWGLCEDAQRYDTFSVACDVPTLVFQGRRDDVVSPLMVDEFARSRPNVRLRLLDDDHQLRGSFDAIWRESAEFLGITGVR